MPASAAELMAQVAKLTLQAADLLAEGRVAEAEEVDRRAAALRRRAMRTAREEGAAGAATAAYAPAQSDRDMVVEGLTELDAISSPRLISDFVLARYGRHVNARLFSSLRRDERDAWQRWTQGRGGSRLTFVVPALEGTFFTTSRGLVALSMWPLARRIVGPRTGRVELLRAARSVLSALAWMRERDTAAAVPMERLASSLARTVPGAMEGWRVGAIEDVTRAVEWELRELEQADRDWREVAAARALTQLTEEEQVLGSAGPHVVRRASGGIA